MPIQPCKCAGGKSGERWGHHGHCYCGKGAARKAGKQAAAAYAHGYQEDDGPEGAMGARFGHLVKRLLEIGRRCSGGTH